MAGKIPKAFIDELIARTDIVELIDLKVTLKKTGTNYSACCPFHDEKTPSFSVSSTKQFYYCFGCGATGNVIGFLMAYDGLAFPDAVEQLAQRQGLTVPQEGGQSLWSERDSTLSALLNDACLFYQQQLRHHADKNHCINYLKDRGITGEIAKQFRLGFAPEGWQNCLEAMKAKGYSEEQVLDAGLAVKNDNGRIYDRFRNRLLFPIRDRKGQVIAFGGRVLDDSKPKYLNSPETALFHKAKSLYGLFEAQQSKQAAIIVVEGYMDVIAVSQLGWPNVVATLGTAVTENHGRLLFRQANRLAFCFDGDKAGQKAAWRAFEVCLPLMEEGRQATFMFLPTGEDPDTFIRQQGLAAFQQHLAESPSFSEYFINHLQQQCDCSTLDGRSELIALARPYLQKLQPNLFREMLIKQLADLVRLDSATMMGYLQSGQAIRPQQGRLAASDSNPVAVPTLARRTQHQTLSLTERIISLLLVKPSLLTAINDEIKELMAIGLSNCPLLVVLLENMQGQTTTGAILENLRDKAEVGVLARLATKEWELDDEALTEELVSSVNRLIERSLEQQKSEVIAKVDKLGLTSLTLAEKALFGKVLGQVSSET